MKKLARNILKKQFVMKIVLNGGKYELDDATIPFQIGFDKSIVDSKPTHILVIDVINDPFTGGGERRDHDLYAKRTIFELEPIQYLQLNRPGINHLIFILLKRVGKDDREYFLEKNRRIYENELFFSSIEENKLPCQICYAEVVVDVPEQFFAPEPKTKFQKAINHWVNSWYESKPVDECDYRKRKIPAFTIKPVLWLLGLIPRIICSILLAVIIPVFRLLFFLAGLQPVYFFPNYKKLLIDFLFLYPHEGYKRIFSVDNCVGYLGKESEEDVYDYKTLAIGKKRIHVLVTFFGLIYYSFMFSLYGFGIYGYWINLYSDIVFSLFAVIGLLLLSLTISHSVLVTISTAKGGEEWKRKWRNPYSIGDKRTKKGGRVTDWVTLILTGIALLSFLITQITWNKVGQFLANIFSFVLFLSIGGMFIYLIFKFLLYPIFKLLSPVVKEKMNKISAKRESGLLEGKTPRKTSEQQHELWLHESFDINNLPKKVDFKEMPEPSSVVQKFRISFWRLKAKVCRPYGR